MNAFKISCLACGKAVDLIQHPTIPNLVTSSPTHEVYVEYGYTTTKARYKIACACGNEIEEMS